MAHNGRRSGIAQREMKHREPLPISVCAGFLGARGFFPLLRFASSNHEPEVKKAKLNFLCWASTPPFHLLQ